MGNNLKVGLLLTLLMLAASGCSVNQMGCGSSCGYGDDCCDPCSCECGSYCCDGECGCCECCEPACGCGGGDCCEPGCGCGCDDGCEPDCGCGGYCNGRNYAGQTWDCCDGEGMKFCRCTGPTNCCEPGCGCDDCCEECCQPCCDCGGYCDSPCANNCCDGCEPSCACGYGNSMWSMGGLFAGCGRFCSAMLGSCGGGSGGCSSCSGCSPELYWSEWHNDPPRCCDPCDRCGNWIGPSAGYQAPYSHPYQVSKHVSAAPSTRTVRKPKPSAEQTIQR